MSTNKKHIKSHDPNHSRIAKPRRKGISGLGGKTAKVLPDTSGIPWCSIKTRTKA